MPPVVVQIPITEDTLGVLVDFLLFDLGAAGKAQGVGLVDATTGDTLVVAADGSITTALKPGGAVEVTDGADTLAINADGSLVVRLSDGTDTLLVNADGSINAQAALAVGAQIKIHDGTDVMLVNADGSINTQAALAVGATIKLWDGVDTVGVNADGSLVVRLSDGTDSLAINTDGSLNTNVTLAAAAQLKVWDGVDVLLIDSAGRIGVNQRKGTPVESRVQAAGVATLALAANANRISALIQNVSTVDCYLGTTAGVDATKTLLVAGASFTDESTTAAWYTFPVSGTGDLRIVEVS